MFIIRQFRDKIYQSGREIILNKLRKSRSYVIIANANCQTLSHVHKKIRTKVCNHIKGEQPPIRLRQFHPSHSVAYRFLDHSQLRREDNNLKFMELSKLTKIFEKFTQKLYPSSKCNLADLSERVDSIRVRGSVNGTIF